MINLDLDFQNPEGYTDIPDENTIVQWVNLAASTSATVATVNDEGANGENRSVANNDFSLTVRIVSEDESHALNKQYRHKDNPTNVLSFPFDPPPIPMPSTHLGDLVMCKKVIENEAIAQHKSSNDHWAHMIIHGLLHLQGYDHLTEEQATEMETLEIDFLHKLGINNPY